MLNGVLWNGFPHYCYLLLHLFCHQEKRPNACYTYVPKSKKRLPKVARPTFTNLPVLIFFQFLFLMALKAGVDLGVFLWTQPEHLAVTNHAGSLFHSFYKLQKNSGFSPGAFRNMSTQAHFWRLFVYFLPQPTGSIAWTDVLTLYFSAEAADIFHSTSSINNLRVQAYCFDACA